ncbi:MAG: hypothetical protein RL723_442 [Actinomycetota bacterium]
MQLENLLFSKHLELRKVDHPTQWYFCKIYLREEQIKIGEINFHRSPAGDEFTPEGTIEVGVEILGIYRGNGFAQEALRTFWLWACEQPEVKVLRYTVSATNHPSMRIIQKFGFTHVGQQIDAEDGPEEIFEMRVEVFNERFAN